MSAVQHKIWCDDEKHFEYEYFADFNEWLDGVEGVTVREEHGVENLSQPSKALFAGDREAYDEAFQEYRKERRHEALGETYLVEQFGGDHWFQRNHDHFMQLIDLMEKGEVVPFIGAGVSASQFPSWKDHLREQGKTANIDASHIETLLASGAYEQVLEEIESIRGQEVFIQEVRDVFSRNRTIPDVVWRISEVFTDTLITTNYDRLVEQAFDTGEENKVQIINGMNALEAPDPGKTIIVKIHGDIRDPKRCILSKNQYDAAYGNGELDLHKPIPKLLAYHFRNSSLLFLGCSLVNDRTVQVFQKVKEKMGEEEEQRQHFSIEQIPEDTEALAQRVAFLAKLGIAPIWFEKERYEYVESILRLAKNELRHRGVPPASEAVVPSDMQTVNLDVHLSSFISDFIDLMPLMHWLHYAVPRTVTGKYLATMQRVFYSNSIVTSTTNQNLTRALDNLLRPLSISSELDDYAHGKFLVAFKAIQLFLKSIGDKHYLGDEFEWNIQEILYISSGQLETLVSHKVEEDPDYHAIRLIIALLNHAKNQRLHPNEYCELPSAVNHEFGEYLSLILSKNLGITVPDRLDQGLTDDVRHLCEDAWDNVNRPVNLKFFERVKLMVVKALK